MYVKNQKRILAISIFGIVCLALLLPIIIQDNMPIANLAANFPQIPGWVLIYLGAFADVTTVIGIIAAVLASAGLASIASVAISYIKKHGVKYGLAL